ncbi:competence/damage-inducible protein A [Pseudalkalibacillus caeni]|uniref:Putative competence-damage inducible protein n=1 Tax=Exobacillus caeni TaxID=2574798 RepID=A0A5R9F1G0_9BACL|nr:competence/damage-inducible protein A [Pseudalkalibacillus caeni]TLS37397.1 competence/damage-inducible protein A [Pseudalkalibacillus caeni]
MNAEIIAIGSELLLGQIANTNAQYLSRKLADIGINVYYHTVVGDNSERLKQVITTAKSRSDLLIFTGGLGPTKDDLTKETIADAAGRNLVYDEKAMSAITGYYKKVNKKMSDNNKKQALVIEGATVFNNDTGMAPGIGFLEGETHYILLPGPPKEMKPMFSNYVEPYLKQTVNHSERIVSRVLRFFGIGESLLETKLEDLIERQSNPTIAPLAGDWEVTLRLTAKETSAEKTAVLLDEAETEIQRRVGDFFYGYGETSLAIETVELLKERKLTVAAAESLTGGLFSKEVTDVSGVSSLFKGSFVCYTNEAKKQLHVPDKLLQDFGAVSEECAKELAENARKQLNADIGISFTGVAGPDKSEGKEVGTVYIGLSTETDLAVHSLQLAGNRESIRARTVKHGFFDIMKHLQKGE